MPGPSKRTKSDHKLLCRVMRAEKRTKASKEENVRLKGVMMATQPTKTSTALALTSPSQKALAKSGRRVSAEELLLRKRQELAQAMGHATVCVASLTAVAKMYGVYKKEVVKNVCACAELFLQMQFLLLGFIGRIFEAIVVPRYDGALALSGAEKLVSYTTDHIKSAAAVE